MNSSIQSNIWFSGLNVLIFIFLKYLFKLDGETLEWITYFCIFFTLYFLYFINNILKFDFKSSNFNYTYILSLPAIVYILLNYKINILHIFFLFNSLLFLIYLNKIEENKLKFNLDNFTSFLFFLLLFYISTKYILWASIHIQDSWEIIDHFVFYKVLEGSKHINYKEIIEFLIPIVVLSTYLFFNFIIILFLSKDLKINLIKKYWWVLPLIIFFLESFNTTNFFIRNFGQSFHHWQVIVGPLEMMGQGGHLLWNVPSQNCFLNMIIAYLMPFEDAWFRLYFFNSLLTLSFSMLFFYVVWNKRDSIYWYIISFLISYSVLFLTLGGIYFYNPSITPFNGPMRFICALVLLYVIFISANKNLKTQVFRFLPIWLIGTLWSFESAVYVSATILPFVIVSLFSHQTELNLFRRIYYLVILPLLSLLIIILFIILYYKIKLNIYPDFFAFIETSFSWLSGKSYYTSTFDYTGPVWIPIIYLSIIISFFFQHKKSKNNYLIFTFISFFIATSSYFISNSHNVDILKHAYLFFFGLMLMINFFSYENFKRNFLLLSPIFIILLTFSYGNMYFIKHVKNTLLHQDYFLKKIEVKENEDIYKILSIIKPGNIPVTIIEPGRYLQTLKKKEYIDTETKKLIQLNDSIWLPYHPATLILTMSLDRKIHYIRKWIDLKKPEIGWFINSKIDWHIDEKGHSFEDAVNLALSDYQIVKKVEHGELKALLYQKMN